MAAQIKVTGLKELRRTLKEMEGDDSWRAELASVNREAADVAVTEAQSLARRGGTTLAGSHASMGSTAIATIRAGGGATRATITGGRASVPWWGGWNFGSGGAHRQFPNKGNPDNSLYKSIENKRDEITETYTRGIDRFTAAKFR
jgi:hypothetical protein